VCISDCTWISLPHFYPQELHLNCLYFSFLSPSACPCLRSV
jgi:hypothetical protein